MPLWLLSAFGVVKKGLGAVLSLVTRYPLQCAMIVALVACAGLWRANSHLRDGIKAERAAHAQTVANYRHAQEEAEARQKANLVRVAAQRKAENERSKHELETYRADADARYDRLLASAKAYRGIPQSPDVSAAVEAGCIAFAATPCAELPAKLKAAQDNTDQLVALINAVETQGKVGTSARDLDENPSVVQPVTLPRLHLPNSQIAQGDDVGH